MANLRPLDEVASELRACGYALSADKLQRLRDFGIKSKRVGRCYYMSDETVQRLSYFLEVEKTLGLSRNHNLLALELAYRGYPAIPWKRVHKGGQTTVLHLFNMINRAFQRMTGKRKSVPTEQRIIKLSRQVARQLIPDTRLDEQLSTGLSRELLERVLEIILRAVYLDQDARLRDVEKLLIDNGLTDEHAKNIAAQLVPLFNKLRPTLRITNNEFFLAIREPASANAAKATVRAMRQLRDFLRLVKSAFAIPNDLTVEDYPTFVTQKSRHTGLTVSVHALWYAIARWILNNDEGTSNLQRLLSGELDMTTVLTDLSLIISAIPKAIGMQYE